MTAGAGRPPGVRSPDREGAGDRTWLFTLGLLAIVATLATGAANAADLPRKALPMVVPVPVFSWIGLCIGINGGYGLDSTRRFHRLRQRQRRSFGVQGSNYQFVGSPIVIGIEADYQGANIKAVGVFFSVTLTNVDWSGSAPSAAASASPGIAS